MPQSPSFPKLDLARPLRDLPADEQAIFKETALIHGAILGAGQLLASKFNPVALLAQNEYFRLNFTNLTNILKAKMQGQVLVVDPDAPEGEQLEMRSSPYFVYLANLAEEMVVTAALKGAMDGQVDTRELLEMSAIFAFAKLSVEQAAATLEGQRLRMEARGETQAAAQIKRRRFLLQRVFFNGIVPLMRTVRLMTPKRHSEACSRATTGTLAAFGCYSLAQEAVRLEKLIVASKAKDGSDCPRLLLVVGEGAGSP